MSSDGLTEESVFIKQQLDKKHADRENLSQQIDDLVEVPWSFLKEEKGKNER